MLKRFIGERKNILIIIVGIALCAAVFSIAEIFLFKGNLIVFSVILASGCSTTFVHLVYRLYNSRFLRRCIEEKDTEILKDFKFYDVSKTNGVFELIVDSFDVNGKASRCRLMNCLEIIPVIFLAIQAIIAAATARALNVIWASELLFFFVMLNINIHLSYIYKNSLVVGKEADNYVDHFEGHILLQKPMLCAYIFVEAFMAVLGFVCIFVSFFNRYQWIIFAVAIVAISAVLSGAYIGIKVNKSRNL